MGPAGSNMEILYKYANLARQEQRGKGFPIHTFFTLLRLSVFRVLICKCYLEFGSPLALPLQGHFRLYCSTPRGFHAAHTICSRRKRPADQVRQETCPLMAKHHKWQQFLKMVYLPKRSSYTFPIMETGIHCTNRQWKMGTGMISTIEKHNVLRPL